MEIMRTASEALKVLGKPPSEVRDQTSKNWPINKEIGFQVSNEVKPTNPSIQHAVQVSKTTTRPRSSQARAPLRVVPMWRQVPALKVASAMPRLLRLPIWIDLVIAGLWVRGPQIPSKTIFVIGKRMATTNPRLNHQGILTDNDTLYQQICLNWILYFERTEISSKRVQIPEKARKYSKYPEKLESAQNARKSLKRVQIPEKARKC